MSDKDKDRQPTPRLRHVKPGQVAHLLGYDEGRVLVSVDKHFGYFDKGLKASLDHLVKEDQMVFGGGQGWRVNESIPHAEAGQTKGLL